MTLDIVGAFMRNTKGRVAGVAAGKKGRNRRQSSFHCFTVRATLVALALAVLLVSSLASCGGGSTEPDVQVVAPTRTSMAVSSTREPATQQPTEPVVAAPTSTPLPPTPTVTLTPPVPAAAVVNGQYIFMTDYERRVAQYQEAMVQQGVDPASADGQESLAQIRQEVLDSMIDYVLIEQGGVALGVSLSETDLENQIQEDIAAGGGQAAFDEWLQTTGQTRDEYKEMLRESLLSQKVMAMISANVPDVVEQVHARQIVVDDEAAAQDVLASLRQGADFVALARERSVDVATRDNGGDLGWFPRGLVAPELEDAAFALQPGEFSDSIPLAGRYHVIQVVERDPARALSVEEKVDLNFAMFDHWLGEQRAAAEIERFVGE
jgi:parvulin-like peptidyl-prolyl isomerase